jgi:type IV secretory pathway VirD2 relaxase
MEHAERDLGTILDWVAVDHWNTEHPHIHIIVRGRVNDGRDLVISRDYIREGMRARAQELLTLELGPRSDHEIRRSLEAQIEAKRWTRLDRVLAREAIANGGIIDLRPNHDKKPGELHAIKIGRVRKLDRLGLAHQVDGGQWVLAENAESTLRELGERSDIIKRIHRGLAQHSWERGPSNFVLTGETEAAPVIGRLVVRGLDDELKGSAYAVIDGIDGRVHHVRFADLDATADCDPESIVEVRPYEDARGRKRLALAVRSDLTIAAQVKANGATWLDRRLLTHGSTLSDMGFGHDVRQAMDARADHLISQGLARREGQRVTFVRDLLATLRRRELDAAGAKSAAETGLPYHSVAEGESISGLYRQRLSLASGRFAMIDDGLGFTLVPWTPSLEHHLGRQVSGVVRSGGTIEWGFRRTQGLAL